MKNAYARVYGTRGNTPLHTPLPGAESVQIPNSDGAYVFPISDWERIKRFVLLGSEGGSYYASEQKLTQENAETTLQAIRTNGPEVVRMVTEISEAGRAPKNDPALFVLAMCFAFGDRETKQAAKQALPRVARIGTHLFHFVEYVNGMRGWGRGLKSAVANWYLNGKTPKALALDVVKYAQRDGWSHRDLLRLAHPKASDTSQQAILHYVTKGWETVGDAPHPDHNLQILWATEKARTAGEREILRLIEEYHLPMECIPTEKRTAKVYEALIPTSGITFLLRNLGNLSKHGVLADGQWGNRKRVTDRLTDPNQLKRGRVHPLSILMALNTYKNGGGMRGSGSWPVVQEVLDALDEAFYLAFDAIEPAGARYVLGCDVSGSMECGQVAGMTGINPRTATAVMAMATKRVEPFCATMAFTHEFVELNLTRKMRLDQVLQTMANLNFGATDCSLPITWATENRLMVDAFVIYTDNETNSGMHPVQALQQYRDKMGLPAKLIVVSLIPNQYSISRLNLDDPGCLLIAGFDTAAPAVIGDFARGNL